MWSAGDRYSKSTGASRISYAPTVYGVRPCGEYRPAHRLSQNLWLVALSLLGIVFRSFDGAITCFITAAMIAWTNLAISKCRWALAASRTQVARMCQCLYKKACRIAQPADNSLDACATSGRTRSIAEATSMSSHSSGERSLESITS